MTSSSTNSSIRKTFKYDVFLSFRGEVRNNFVGHLYNALEQKGIETYKDDEKIEKGKTIDDQLIRSIEDSRLFIIVFSKNYASSSWCLDELVKIMECQKTAEQTAYPIFYDVEPTEVRKQSGAVKYAFSRHEKKEAAGKWIEALKQASKLAGWDLKATANGDESRLTKLIVDDIFKKLCSINSSVDRKLVGMEVRIKAILSSLEMGANDVRMIGIKGMGGGGKTTLARTVYDQISIHFEGKSFVENVREVSKASLSGLKKLQKQIVSNVLNKQDITIGSVHDGTNMMKKMMCGRKVLIVLDDVDNIDQLEVLAGEPNWFKSGSRIIITTRDEQVLVAHGVNIIHNINLLSHKEAICLFSRYAFRREIPIEGYKELSEQVVQYADGLPLTIKVLGSFLCGQSEPQWIDALQRLKTVPLKATMEKLELSYDGLEADYKDIFLDVACILKGWNEEDAIRALESRGFHARNGLRVLEQKSLITISDHGYLGMHDHIEEMGRDIVRRLHPDEPNRRSRLWNCKEIEEILANEWGTQATKCMTLRTEEYNADILMKGLANMKDLRFLDVYCKRHVYSGSNGKCNEVRRCLPNALRFLRWQGYPFWSLPKTFQASNLVGLDMHSSDIVHLWKDGEEKVLYKLRFLKLSNLKLKTLDIRFAPNIEKLTIFACYDLVEVQMPAESLKLIYLNVCYSKLKTLHLGITPNLEELSLEGCNDLVELHMPAECPKLVSLDLTGLKLRILHLAITPNLKTLYLEDCNDLVELYIPESLKLKSLNLISRSKLRTLHLGITPNLELLNLEQCCNLVELHMPFGCTNLRSMVLCQSKLRTLDIGLTPNLERLYLTDCSYLVEINTPIGCLKNLLYLDLSGCGRFNSFLFDKQLDSLEVGSLSELHLIGELIDVCPLHSDNNFPKFKFLCYYKEDLDSSFGNLEKLISVGLCACTTLEKFSGSISGLRCLGRLTLEGSIPEVPKDLNRLEYLGELILSSTTVKHLPDSICKLKYLKSFKIISCCLLENLPDDLGQLEYLETLIVKECILSRDIPNSICEMKCLEYFHLRNSNLVEIFPEEFGRLECLKELDITGTYISHLPQSIFRLKGLRIVGDRWLLESFGLTPKIRRTTDGNGETFCYI